MSCNTSSPIEIYSSGLDLIPLDRSGRWPLLHLRLQWPLSSRTEGWNQGHPNFINSKHNLKLNSFCAITTFYCDCFLFHLKSNALAFYVGVVFILFNVFWWIYSFIHGYHEHEFLLAKFYSNTLFVFDIIIDHTQCINKALDSMWYERCKAHYVSL